MYISNPNRRNRANTPQQSAPPRRIPEPIPYNSNFQFRPPQAQINPLTPQTPPPQAPQMNDTGMGGLVVRVTTASGAIPLEDAMVTVSDYATGSGGNIVATLRTNSSGLTEKISLPTPPKSMSLSPGNGKSYSSYIIEVQKEGYNNQQYINVPVFDGVIAVQNADLVPLPENGETDRADPYNPGIFYESEAPRLDQTNQNT